MDLGGSSQHAVEIKQDGIEFISRKQIGFHQLAIGRASITGVTRSSVMCTTGRASRLLSKVTGLSVVLSVALVLDEGIVRQPTVVPMGTATIEQEALPTQTNLERQVEHKTIMFILLISPLCPAMGLLRMSALALQMRGDHARA